MQASTFLCTLLVFSSLCSLQAKTVFDVVADSEGHTALETLLVNAGMADTLKGGQFSWHST
eukprot:665031-Rhodomonas_salina.2